MDIAREARAHYVILKPTGSTGSKPPAALLKVHGSPSGNNPFVDISRGSSTLSSEKVKSTSTAGPQMNSSSKGEIQPGSPQAEADVVNTGLCGNVTDAQHVEMENSVMAIGHWVFTPKHELM